MDIIQQDLGDMSLKDGEDPKVKFDCPRGYEVIAQGYWYGFKEGCLCNGDFGGMGKYPKVSYGKCTREQDKFGCRYVPESPPETFPIVNK